MTDPIRAPTLRPDGDHPLSRELLSSPQTAEAYFRAIFNETADAILIADQGGRYLDANSAAEQLLGYTIDELTALSVGDVVAAGQEWTDEEYARFVAEGIWRGELELRRKSGELVPVESVATLIELPSGTVGVSVIRDITGRRTAEAEQRDFLAAVTHELKNPLTPVVGLAKVLARTGQADREALQEIATYAERLERVIDDLLDASSMDAGRFEIQRASVDLVALVEDVVAMSRRTWPAHPIEFRSSAVGAVRGLWDAQRMAQVFGNLISNAVKYSPEGSPITVSLDARDDEVEVAVDDRGIGIPRTELHRVFDQFYRSSEAKRKDRGVGLGLYIAKMLVEAHGGTITATSDGPGRGSTFRVVLPLARDT